LIINTLDVTGVEKLRFKFFTFEIKEEEKYRGWFSVSLLIII
jgi:hypothetical protein